MGRHSKLDDDRLQAIIAALRIGLSEKEAAQTAGISERTFYNWKARARAAGDVLPSDWERLKFQELLAVADELDIDLQRVRRTGQGNRLTRADVLRLIRDRCALYVDFLHQVEAAGPNRKQALLQVVDDLIHGRVKIRRTRTTQAIKYIEKNGQMVPQPAADAVVVTEVLELPPDRQAVLKMLAMGWPDEFSERRNGGTGGPPDASASAREVSDAVHRMLSTVPGPAALLTEGEEENP